MKGAAQKQVLRDPPFADRIFNHKKAAWFWLVLRVWLGWQWIQAAQSKITNPAWVETGNAVKGFWTGAVQVPETGRPPIAFTWYRRFIQFLLDTESYTWFGKLVAYGELLVGIALVIGAFTGIAAFFSGLMNWNFMMAGSAGTNPLLFVSAVGLILAWKVAGRIGADYFLLKWLGTPWQAGEGIPKPEGGLEREPSPIPE
jgi:thiosulfate dehydrogenase [quinone] large subunit